MNFERQEFARVEEGKRQMELPCLNGHAFWAICRHGMNESGKSKYFLVTFLFGMRIIDPFTSQEVEADKRIVKLRKKETTTIVTWEWIGG